MAGSLGFQAEGKFKDPGVKAANMSRQIRMEKPSLGSGNNEVIGGLCSRGFGDAHQMTGFAERTGNDRVEREGGRRFGALGC